MSLFDAIGASRQTLLLSGLLMATLASCQVRPLYETVEPGTVRPLASIAIDPADDRVEQEVRNNLIFLASGGAGEAKNAAYQLDLNVSVRNIGVLLEKSSDTARAGRIVVSASYSLSRTGTGEVVASGNRSVVALVDFSSQEYARIRATSDAEDRGARELAEIIYADLASNLER